MKYILGINDGNDAGAALICDGKLVAAVNEERLVRKKNYCGFPYRSIRKVLQTAQISPKDIDKIAVGSEITPSFILRLMNNPHKRLKKDNSQFSWLLKLYTYYQSISKKMVFPYIIDRELSRLIISFKLRSMGIKTKIEMVEHHSCHAHSAYKASGFKESLIITFDGMGDGLCLTVNIAKGDRIKRIFSQSASTEVGYYYSRITELLGFVPNRHEGKITGLAAYGGPSINMRNFLSFKGGKINILASKKDYFRLMRYKKEDIASSVQKNFENTILEFVQYWIKKTGINNICLSGGAFGNVKLNQRISKISDKIFVFPHMGDGGLAAGAAMYFSDACKIKNLYLGPEFENNDIDSVIEEYGLKSFRFPNIEKEIARLLRSGEVIARFDGRMEFGPRALGNRSILYRPDDPNARKHLNKILKRTEFMPFAPSTLQDLAHKCYSDLEGAEETARFMTISFNCTDWMKRKCPGAVHVDGTARPQLVKKEDNERFYKIIEEFYKISGIPCLINTSFNMHEEPIVCNPKDALKVLKNSNINFLIMGDRLVKNE